MDKITRIKELVELLNNYTQLYDEGMPIISDSEWDKLYFELQDLEKDTGVRLENSPTQKIHYEVKSELEKVEHNHPLLSLAKTKNISDLEDFIGDKHYLTMLKVDGLTLSIRYLNGKLISAETRGNGLIGEDITHNAFVIKNLPKRINFKDELIVDGEAVILYSDFEEFQNDYANPRNLASGSIRLLDSREAKKRNISFIAWDCYKGLEKEDSLNEKLNQLDELGFITVPRRESIKYSKTIENYINEVIEESKKLGIPYDGAVIKYDSYKEYIAAGKTEHHFSGGIAYKFYDESIQTELLNIEYNVSRQGILTPVAIFKPIQFDDAEVNKASLSNLSVLKEKLGTKPYIGQKIWVSKRNMIIPYIEKAEKNNE